METSENSIQKLEKQLESLIQKQNDFFSEINHIKQEISKLKTSESNKVQNQEKSSSILTEHTINDSYSDKKHSLKSLQKSFNNILKSKSDKKENNKQAHLKNLEKFIGENLMNKVGIAITIIGLAIGTKYSIEHNLINPLTRIILGYLFTIGLLIIGIRLHPKYKNHSAVLVSGAMTTKYFNTFSAYNFYELTRHYKAFILMVIFTIFTVLAALPYKQQIIAHIGLVGAYAIPFLLSNNSRNVQFLFSN